jgi:ammonium transporter, Amt family
MAMERTVPARLKAGLLGRMAVAIKALNAAWISGEANGAVQSLAPRSPAQGDGAKRGLTQRIKGASVPETAEIALVVNPFLGEMRQIAGNLAAHAGLAGEASVQLAAMSRRTPFSASGWQHPERGLARVAHANPASIVPDLRSESAFVAGAAQSLEASIDGASQAISELAVAIDGAASAPSAAALSAQAKALAQDAKATIAELSEAIRRINEIVAFIEKVALPTNLLALDAAIGAARAADAEGGFEHAAAEIRALATPLHATSSAGRTKRVG